MPNHVITTITTDQVENQTALEALGRYLTEEERLEETLQRESLLKSLEERKSAYRPEPLDLDHWVVDFAQIIPEPENMFHGGCDGNHPHRDAEGNPLECWYSWNVNNWGTKWNAYSVERNEGEVKFETAWSHPYPVIEALSRRFPEVTFDVRYADEDRGANCGHYTIKDGVVEEAEMEDGVSWLQFAVELWGQSWEDYQAEMAEYARQDAEYEAMQVPAVETAVVKGEVL